MVDTFSPIDLSQLPAPTIVETLDFETLLTARKERLISLYPAAERAAIRERLALESDPVNKLLQENAYRELVLRQRVNDATRGVMLAFAVGTDLDQLGANFSVTRLLLKAANPNAVPPTAAVYESDDDFRARIQLSPEGYTTAGSQGSYVFHGLSADGNVRDVQAISPAPTQVTIYVLSRLGTGLASPELLAKVTAALNAEKVRPLTDKVTVLSANIVDYQVNAELTLYDGPDSDVVVAAAYKAVEDYAASVKKIGYDVALSGLYKALHQSGVQAVKLTQPAASLVLGNGEASNLTGVTLTVAGATNV
ncbi:phage-related baseplate assembly protein [Pseudomonas sp. SORGH_AS 211]|uniref:baseplate assembly protein n=1 Tax=unclassified Pseudomonas TaxID=196821 RepID=UPI0002FBEE88|nr:MULTISPECIES: baseplate J/gp47 family protein [unclassified Pseudomonas]MDR6178380.1 phage-related baseplate assembly protein [Pseudomonas sp. SORGH_AS_0211]MDR6230441.1 phage-related baseplate assembly protein [Pseudomonas sp. SORGH_AS_0199]